jgi:hypothetical protein
MRKRLFYVVLLFLVVWMIFPANTKAQGTLQFNRVILVDNNLQTVPVSKVWKVESVMSVNTLIPAAGTTDNTYYTITKIIEVNTNQVVISRASRYTENSSRYNSESTTDIGIGQVTELPLWLPQGTTLKTGTNALYISVIEFNIVP